MKKKSAKQIPLPDINATSAADFAARQKSSDSALMANRADQKNPFGSIDWSRDPVSGEWTQTETYNPEQQGLLDQRVSTQGVLGNKGQQVAEGLDAGYANAPGMPTVGGYNEQAMNTIRALQAPEIRAPQEPFSRATAKRRSKAKTRTIPRKEPRLPASTLLSPCVLRLIPLSARRPRSRAAPRPRLPQETRNPSVARPCPLSHRMLIRRFRPRTPPLFE